MFSTVISIYIYITNLINLSETMTFECTLSKTMYKDYMMKYCMTTVQILNNY